MKYKMGFFLKPQYSHDNVRTQTTSINHARAARIYQQARSVKPLAALCALGSCRAAGTTASVARLLAAASRSGTRSVWVHGCALTGAIGGKATTSDKNTAE